MSSISLILVVYLGSILFVSGVAKLGNLGGFQATLYRHGILPRRIVPRFSSLLPVFQVLLAYALIAGILPYVTAGATLVLFVAFLCTELMLLARKKAAQCGCYGVAFPLAVDRASVVASLILVCLAAVNVVASLYPASAVERWPVALCCGAIYTLLALRVLWRHFRGRTCETAPAMHLSSQG